MNIEHLGDALDHWKGSLISLLLRKQLLANVVAEPMITDAQPWPEEEIQTYKRIIGLEALGEAIVHATSTFHGANRKDYFNDVPKDGDIFLDPDIGIAGNGASRKHIKVSELIDLLSDSRVVMVYQHSAHSNFTQWLLAIKNKLTADAGTDSARSVHCTVYECGQVAMFFISRDRNRIDKIKTGLQEYLRGTAQQRVW